MQSESVSVDQAYGIAVGHFQSGDLAGAEDVCRQILKIEPRHPDTLHLMGVIANQNGRHKAAVKMIKQAIKERRDVPAYYSNLALALQDEGKHYDALQNYRQALALDPNIPEAHMNMGNILKEQGKLDEAMASFAAAAALDPAAAAPLYNMGLALHETGDLVAAAEKYEKALELEPMLTVAHTNLGVIYSHFGHDERAIAHLRHAVALNPEHIKSWISLGNALNRQKKFGESLEAYGEALKVEPDNSLALAGVVHQLQHACDWAPLGERVEKLLGRIRARGAGVTPFACLVLDGATQEDHLICAADHIAAEGALRAKPYQHKPRGNDGRIRIGYLSCDLHGHATAYLIAELIEKHDREKFEVIAYSYGGTDHSPMRARLEKAFDRFVDMVQLTYADAAELIYNDKVDILVDLKGYTMSARPQVTAMRPAPIQVNYLGYPGTMGTDRVDYILGDAFILPFEHQKFYPEKIVHLPGSYQPNDRKRAIAPEVPTRAACGLPENGFVFCSFNNVYKYTPQVFDVWMRLLKEVEGSVFWLFEANTLVKENLLKEAAARGVDPARLVFAPPLPLPQHLARHANADLFLDSLPVNAHTTASDALWAGLPVLTCAGDAFIGRVAGSLLHAVGLPELVTQDLADYEALALKLARDPALLQGFRDRLAAARDTTPLFDTDAYVRGIEKAYEEMWRRFEAGEPPAPFAVAG